MSDKRKIIRGSDVVFTKEQMDEIERQIERQNALGKTIRSTAYANIVDLVSEGEIQGLVNGLKSVYLDETPIQNADNSYNFEGVTLATRNGTQSQTYIPGFTEVQDDINVQVKVTFSAPVTRQITNSNIDAVIVKITTPSLTLQNTTTGEIGGNSVLYKIQLQSNGGGYVDVISSELIGKSTSQYQKSHRIELTGASPWDIRLVRVSPDSVSIYDTNDIYFDSYTEVIDVKLTYPNSAIVSLKVDAAKFSNIPRRAFDLKGMKIRIPSNATVRADGSLSFTGTWDGTFQTAWSTCPAFCFYDILISDRYGLGQYIPSSQVDKWSLYAISVYCNELVSNGLGGTEPRFSCNIYLQSAESAYKVLQDMATIFRGMAYWSNGSIVATQDSPSDPSYLYTQANVIEGNFNYSGASRRAMHTVALVAWNDPEDFYRPKVEYVEDQEAIALYGVVKTQVTAIGCTSRGQAHRVGKWILFTEQNESEVVSFKTGVEGSVARPGQIVKIADSNRSGRRLAGRISASTLSSITVDSDPESSYVGMTLFTLLPTGVVEERTIDTQNGRVLTVTTPFSVEPSTIWMISTPTVEPQTYRILSVTEAKVSGEMEITGIKYVPEKYAAVEDGATLPERSYSIFKEIPPAPQDLLVTENLYNTAFGVKAKATLSWTHIPKAVNYVVKFKKDSDNVISAGIVNINEIEFADVTPGTYTFLVYAVNPIGAISAPASITQVIYGKSAPPGNVLNFSMFPNASAAFFTWTKSTDLDVLVGGSVRIRHTPRLTGQTWGSAIDVIDFVPGSDTFATAPLLPGTYMAKFVDSSGNESAVEALALTTVPLPVGLNVVETITETGSFAGVHSNTEFNPSLGLTLSTDVLWDDLDVIDDIEGFLDYQGNIIAAGSYYFSITPDLGQVFTSNLTAYIKTLAFDTGLVIDDIQDLIDDWTDFDGANVAAVNAKLFVRTTEDNPNDVVTRASIGTYYDYQGYVKTAAVDVARLNYNPLNLTTFPTLLLESASTNLFTQSADLSHTDWQPGGNSNYTRTPNVGVGPDGVNGSTLLTVKSGLTSFSTSAPSQYLTKAASVKTYTLSLYVKDNGAGGLRVRFFFDAGVANFINGTFNLQTGTLVSASSGGTASSPSGSIANVGHGWYRVTLTGTSDTSTILRTQIFCGSTTGSSFTGDDIKGTFVWGAQLEEASAVTSYIPTTTAAVTRAADTLVSSPTWTAWKPFLTGSYQARAYQFRIDLTSTSTNQNIAVEELSVTIDMPDRTEEHQDLVSGLVDPFHVDFDYEFNVVPAIGIITHNMISGDYYTMTNKTVSGFDIVFKDISNTVISRTFDVVVKGYGLKG